MSLRGTRTEANLQFAFASESQANRRFLFFAQQADIEGFPEVARLFRTVADGETGQAYGHLEYLATWGSIDPATGMPLGSTKENLQSAIQSELTEFDAYGDFAIAAREEGFVEIAEWFQAAGRAEKSHLERFRQGLEDL